MLFFLRLLRRAAHEEYGIMLHFVHGLFYVYGGELPVFVQNAPLHHREADIPPC